MKIQSPRPWASLLSAMLACLVPCSVPLVEFAVDTPLGGVRRQVATANPGISYVAITWQVAAEAIVPLDGGAGSHVGGRIQLLMFLDDLLPAVFGKPLLSEHALFRSSD